MKEKIKAIWEKVPSAIREALKEGSRVVSLGVVSYLLTEGVLDAVLIGLFGTKLDTATKLYISGLLTTALRAVDKWLHEVGKDRELESGDKSVLTAGLTRF